MILNATGFLPLSRPTSALLNGCAEDEALSAAAKVAERLDRHDLPLTWSRRKARCRAGPWAFYEWRDGGVVPLICPTCQNVSRDRACLRPPSYFAWACFRYFSRERAPRRPGDFAARDRMLAALADT
jgi:hypothetical protein